MPVPDKTSLADWLEHLERLNPMKMRLGLERTARVWQRMDLPSPGKKRLLIGGTNGKGSCVETLRRLGVAHGLRVGCYTSPHLMHFSERIRLPEGEASDQQICAAFERIEQIRADEPLSWFEFTTLAAFDLLSRADLDLALLEIGLGGRLDAVNILEPDAAIVTGVDLDHCHVLGHDRESIGVEKAAIYRPHRLAICGDLQPPASLCNRISEIGAQGCFAGRDYRWQELGEERWRFSLHSGATYDLPRPQLPLSPCAAALAAFAQLYPAATEAVWARALDGAALPGRGQYLPGGPDLLLDVAHNAQAARRFADQVGGLAQGRRTHWILGAMQDKDLRALAEPVAQSMSQGGAEDAVWYPVKAETAGDRAACEQSLAAVLDGLGARCDIIGGGVERTLHQVMRTAQPRDLIAVYGSFYTVGEAMQCLSRDYGYPAANWTVSDPASARPESTPGAVQ